MNKYQKIAVQMAKDDMKKPLNWRNDMRFSRLKSGYYNLFKKEKYPMEYIQGWKSWNKDQII